MLSRMIPALLVLVCATANAQTAVCPALEKGNDIPHESGIVSTWKYRAADGRWALIIGQDMRVNADGAPAAYAVRGQHGMSYLCDGALVSVDRGPFSTKNKESCGAAVAEIDNIPIVDGSIEFPTGMKHRLCIFGFEVTGGKSCNDGQAVLVGDDKPARAQIHRNVLDARGNGMEHFLSTTSLKHKDGRSLDSSTLPFVVAPRGIADMTKGQFGFVVSNGATNLDGAMPASRAIPVVVGDTGPADKFGEGSIAAHQFLAYGELRDGPRFDPLVCQGKATDQCNAANLPYVLTKSFPYPYQDKEGGDVRPKRNWPGKLLYVFFPVQEADRPSEYTFRLVGGNAEGSIAEGARKVASSFGGIDKIVECIRLQKKVGGFQ